MTLRVQSLGVTYGDRAVLHDVQMEVGAGEILAVMGASGSGKSTLLRALCGLVPSTGTTAWGDQDLAGLGPHERGFGMMFQDHALFSHLDVVDNVAFGLKMRGQRRAERRAQAEGWLTLVGLESFGRRRVDTLSGGEQQRVALARALAATPRALLLDEPFASLDRSLRDGLIDELRRIATRTQVAMVVVTHDHGDAFALGDRIALLDGGTVAQCDTPLNFWRQPASLNAARQLGFAELGAATLVGDTVCGPWGRLPTLGAPECDGRPVAVVTRPDAFRLDPAGEFEARVLRVTARATTGVVVVLLAPGVECEVAIREPLAAGALVRLAVDPAAVQWFCESQPR